MIGNWNSTLISQAISDAHTDGAHDLNHLHRVWQTAQTLRQYRDPDLAADELAWHGALMGEMQGMAL